LDSPIRDYLKRLHDDIRGIGEGAVADYIPELGRAAPEACAVSFATIDGAVYSAGDAQAPFTIQSVSKPFAYGAALERLGQAAVLERVGVEPTGEAFNSIVLDEKNNRPFNPMVNAGAIAVAALAPGETPQARVTAMLETFSAFAGRELAIDEAVFRSERATGHRNRAITWLMLNSGMIDRDPEEVLDLYFRQCAITVTCADLAVMGATLANNGVNPRSGARLLSPETVRDVLTLMLSCGMYDYAGEWSFDVGLPAKSGVSGAVLAILPGQLSIAVWSPPLDEIGNSVRGIAACRAISRDFGLHLFMNSATVEDVVRREVRGDVASSLRVRARRERDLLAQEGRRIALVELQGALYFASAERMIRRLGGLIDEIAYLVLDMRRLGSLDAAATRFLQEFVARAQAAGVRVAFSELPAGGAVGEALAQVAEAAQVTVHATTDAALEAFEDRLLDELTHVSDLTRFPLKEIDLFRGLDGGQLARLETVIQPMQFEAGARILRAGEKGRSLFVVARGTVSVLVASASGAPVRIGSIGPGQFFGEMAVLEGGTRAADVIADARVVCYGLTGDALEMLGREDPAILVTVLGNLAREFSLRMRRSNALIAALQ
jgi:glutaminase